MGKISKKVGTSVLCLMLAGIVLAACLWVYPAANAERERSPEQYGGILRLWHIDSFEGGKGSRASFLRGVARAYSEESGVFVLITVHSSESAAAALQGGDMPDLFSFGTDAPFAADIARPLEGYNFSYARAGGDTLAYPWCRGAYFFYTLGGSSEEANASNTVVSTNGSCAPAAAAALSDLPRGEYAAETPVQAYTDLISGKYAYLVGTQRDYWRLRTRGLSFSARLLGGFTDLWQYMCICTAQRDRYIQSMDFLNYLLSEEVQKKLPQIGMFSAKYSVYEEDGILSQAERVQPSFSVSAFLSDEARGALLSSAALALQGDKNGAKKLENFLI